MKLIFAFSMLVPLISLQGCGKDDDSNDSSNREEEEDTGGTTGGTGGSSGGGGGGGSPSKNLFSRWVRTSDGFVLDLRGGSFNVPAPLIFTDGGVETCRCDLVI